MKRSLLIFGFMSLMMALTFVSVGVHAADIPADCPPGCDCPPNTNGDGTFDGVLGAQEAYGDAERMRDKGEAQEVIKQNDNGPGMTCFDQALGVTAKLGNIFSDKVPANMPAEVRAVYGNSQYSAADIITPTLAENLKKVMTGPDGNNGLLQKHTANFIASKSAAFGAVAPLSYMSTLTGSMQTQVNTILDNAGITGTLTNFQASLNALDNFWDSDIVSAISGLATAFGLTQIVNTINSINTTLGNIDNTLNSIRAALSGAINLILGSVFQNILNQDNMSDGSGACDRISKLWGGIAGTFDKAITGVGNDKGAPYFTIKEMIDNTLPPGMGDDIVQALLTDEAVANRLRDALDVGALAGPGQSPTWPDVPPVVFNPNASLQDIIDAM
jgi:hypothetical protein